MADNARMRRLVADRLGDCCDADVERRIEALASIDRTARGDVDDDVAALAALSSETRYRIVRLLLGADEELCVCEFEPVFDVSASAISHALSRLAEADLVSRRKEGRWRYYRATDRAARLVAALDGAGPSPPAGETDA
ncbi:MAG: ArsR/SmtB family transcription factor [Salinigranum sp.]